MPQDETLERGEGFMYTLICDNEYISCAEKLIGSAQGEIVLSTFKIQYDHKHRGDNLRRVIEKLIEKAKAGVKILFLMNWEERPEV